MFNIFANSLFNPKGLVRYVNKKGFFIFIYLLMMALLMSIGMIVSIVGYDNSLISEETTGCRIDDYSLVCDGDNYDVNDIFYAYGFRVYFLDDATEIADITNMNSNSMFLKGMDMEIYINGQQFYSLPLLAVYEIETMTELNDMLASFFLAGGIIGSIVQNFLLILAIALLSSLAFLRFKKEIQYKKIFKLVVFAVTPLAVLFTFYNLLQFGDLIFFILMFFSYRTIFVLQRELYYQLAIRQYQNHQPENTSDDVVESYNYDDIEQEDADEDDEDNRD